MRWSRRQLPQTDLLKNLHDPDGISGLLAWAIALESIQRITAIVPAGLTIHPKHLPLREYVQARRHLCAALSLPPGIFSHMRWLTATVLFLGGSREHAHVDIVPSTEELTHFTSQSWYDRLLL